MKGLGGDWRKRQGSHGTIAQGGRVPAGSLTLPYRCASRSNGGSSTNCTVVSSRHVTLQDILDLTASSTGSSSTTEGGPNNSLETGGLGDLDFESSRVIVVNTTKGSGKRAARKRALSVSPRLGSRGSGAGSSCGSVADAGGNSTTTRGGGAGGFYTWMQSSLRRRLRKRPKKSTLPRVQTPPPPPRHRLPATSHGHLGGVVGVRSLEESEAVPSLPAQEAATADAASSTTPSPPDGEGASSSNYPHPSDSAPALPCPSSCSQPPTTTSATSQTQERVTYVNHRNGSVTAVSAATILQALTSGVSGAKPKAGGSEGVTGTRCGGNGAGRGRLSHTARGRSTSVGRRVALSTTLTAAIAASGPGNKKKGRKHRVFGGAWGLFHCAGAGARSRSCTPERNVNFRVRSRSATPERYLNVRVNPAAGAWSTGGGGGRKKGSMKLVKPKRKSKSSRRRFSADSDEEANKENKYDMWGFIRDRLEGGSGRSGRPCAAERLSRRDTLPCRPRGSVNINRGEERGTDEFSPPDLPQAVTVIPRSVSEKRYDHRAAHLPPTDMCTYIHRVPPTTDVNFNNYGSVLSMHLKNGETLPLNLEKCVGQTSVASSLNSMGSKDSGLSSSSSYSSGTTASGTSRGVARGGSWAVGGTGPRDRTNTLPGRYRNRPLPPIPKPELPPKPPESGIHLVKTLKLDKFMKNKWISGVSVTRKNDLVVVDLKEAYLIDEDGNLKRTIGTSGKGALKEPIDVTVMANGNVAVSDHADQEVKVFTTKGQFVRRIMDKCLANIAGVATGDRRVFIAGTDKRCITVHSEEEGYLYSIPSKENTTTGSRTKITSGYGTTSGGGLKELFEHPYSIAVNPLTCDVIVGDDYKQRVVALSPDGRILWRYSPTGDRHFFPCSIAVDSEGYIFIADLYNEKVYMLDSSGKHLKVLLSRGEGLKGAPGAIAVDGRGHLVVADEERTLKVFKYGDNGFALYRRFSMCPDAK